MRKGAKGGHVAADFSLLSLLLSQSPLPPSKSKSARASHPGGLLSISGQVAGQSWLFLMGSTICEAKGQCQRRRGARDWHVCLSPSLSPFLLVWCLCQSMATARLFVMHNSSPVQTALSQSPTPEAVVRKKSSCDCKIWLTSFYGSDSDLASGVRARLDGLGL